VKRIAVALAACILMLAMLATQGYALWFNHGNETGAGELLLGFYESDKTIDVNDPSGTALKSWHVVATPFNAVSENVLVTGANFQGSTDLVLFFDARADVFQEFILNIRQYRIQANGNLNLRNSYSYNTNTVDINNISALFSLQPGNPRALVVIEILSPNALDFHLTLYLAPL
jgi:hypothetical protein